MLELLKGTPPVVKLAVDLEALVLDASANDYDRIASFRLLLELESYDWQRDIDPLLKEASAASRMLTELAVHHGILGFGQTISLLRALAVLYQNKDETCQRETTSLHFIKTFFNEFPTEWISEYIDLLTADIHCNCDAKREYTCECRRGISKIVGGLLDRYFESQQGPYDPDRIWRWTKDLRYSRPIKAEDSASARTLQRDHELRQSIQKVALSTATTIDQCRQVVSLFRVGQTHAGLVMQADDIVVAVQRAFENDDPVLWEAMWRAHYPYRESAQPDLLRRLMRAQARAKPPLLKTWSRADRATKMAWREDRRLWSSRLKRRAKREQDENAKRAEHLRQNRAQIEGGRHWGWLRVFAQHLLYQPDKFGEIVDDVATAYAALRNCFTFLEEHIPNLEQLAKRERTAVAMVLHAACVLHFREEGTLDGVALDVLKAVKTELGPSEGVPEGEAKALDEEVNRLLFPSPVELERFAREFIESTLTREPNAHTNVEWLRYKTPFQSLQTTLPIKWLRQYPYMPLYAEVSLFNMAAKQARPQQLQELIAERRDRYRAESGAGQDASYASRRNFWLLNSFFYADDRSVWQILKADKNTLLSIAARCGRFQVDDDNAPPPLSAGKIHDILDAFVEVWPKVHLPGSYGSGDPTEEEGYRFLREIPWRIGQDAPDRALPVLDGLLADSRFVDFRNDLLAIRASAARKLALKDFRAPSPAEIRELLAQKNVASVEDLRALIVDALIEIEGQIRHGETDALETFYSDGKHVDENMARNRTRGASAWVHDRAPPIGGGRAPYGWRQQVRLHGDCDDRWQATTLNN